MDPSYPPSSSAHTPDFLGAASLLDLGTVPAGESAKCLVEHLATMVDAHDGLKRRVSDRQKLNRAVGAILGGTLRAWRKGEPVYRPRNSTAFNAELVAHRSFVAAVDGLVGLGLLHTRKHSNRAWDWGEDGLSFTGLAARIWPTDQLLDLASAHGITPATVADAFGLEFSAVPPALPAHLVEQRALMAPRRSGIKATQASERLPIAPDDAEAHRLTEEVTKANEFAAEHDVRGCRPPRWKRAYGPSWLLGGRWYALGGSGCYQTLSKARRSAITIEEQPTAEVDIQASHFSILLGLLGRELPEGDPYAFPEFPRAVTKRWVTATIGKGTSVVRWARDALHDQPELAAYDARAVGAAIIDRYEFMTAPADAVVGRAGLAELAALGRPSRLLAGRIMAIEADALTAAIHHLRSAQGVLALPVHDSLIVPEDQAKLAEEALQLAFRGRAGVVVRTKIEAAGK